MGSGISTRLAEATLDLHPTCRPSTPYSGHLLPESRSDGGNRSVQEVVSSAEITLLRLHCCYRGFVWFIAFGISLTFSVFLVPVSTEFHWTRADTALASSLSVVVMGLLALVMGWLTDRLGPRFVVSFSGLFSVACLLLSRVTESGNSPSAMR